MFLVIDMTEMPSSTTRLNDIKDVRDVVVGITGSVEDGNAAYDAASNMRFGDKFCQPFFEIHCVIVGEETCDLGLHTRKFATTERMLEIANNAVDSFGELLAGRALYDALSGSLKMSDAEILAAGFVTLKEFMDGSEAGEDV